jgi:hypothetical protein
VQPPRLRGRHSGPRRLHKTVPHRIATPATNGHICIRKEDIADRIGAPRASYSSFGGFDGEVPGHAGRSLGTRKVVAGVYWSPHDPKIEFAATPSRSAWC